MKLKKSAKILLESVYLKRLKDPNVIESPEDMFKRVAKSISLADKKYGEDHHKSYKDFYDMISNLYFLPNSPTLFNADDDKAQLFGCYVLPIEDDLSKIFESLKTMALIHKNGGGTGFSFSNLRHKGSVIKSTRGHASGPVSFIQLFDNVTQTIKSGCKRPGANIAVLDVHHPDIEDFISSKSIHQDLKSFNISVGITDTFMKAVKDDAYYYLIDPIKNKRCAKKKARKIFDLLCRCSWICGDPAVLFLDTINKHNPTPKLGRINSTTTCGEAPLLDNEACNLGSINLSRFVVDKRIDHNKLRDIVTKAIHFLDNVIDVSGYPDKSIEKNVKGNRKVGLGVMGFADMLIKMRIGYGTDQALRIAKKVMKQISSDAFDASSQLAKKRGAFPNFKGSIYDHGKKRVAIRNATRTAIAPTGSISMIAGCSSSIEPLFSLSFQRSIRGSDKVYEINQDFLHYAKDNNISKSVIDKAAKLGSVSNLDIPAKAKEIFVCAHDIDPKMHVKMQAAFQRYTDNAVSKTVNLNQDAKVKDIKDIYDLAYKLKCKGISVYRDKSLKEQVYDIGTCKRCS